MYVELLYVALITERWSSRTKFILQFVHISGRRVKCIIAGKNKRRPNVRRPPKTRFTPPLFSELMLFLQYIRIKRTRACIHIENWLYPPKEYKVFFIKVALVEVTKLIRVIVRGIRLRVPIYVKYPSVCTCSLIACKGIRFRKHTQLGVKNSRDLAFNVRISKGGKKGVNEVEEKVVFY